jgi:hypothetical protein
MSGLSMHEFRNFDRTNAKTVLPRTHEALSFYNDQWLGAWALAFLPGHGWARPLTAYSVESGSATLGVIALARQTVSRLRMQSLAGYYWPFRTMAVRDDQASRKAFATSIASHFARYPPATVLRLGPVSSSDKALEELLRSLMEHGWTALRHDGGRAFVLGLTEDAAALEKSMSRSLLKNARYCRRRLEKQFGKLSFDRHTLGAEPGIVLDTAESVERASWISKKGGDLKFIGAANRKFWTSLAAVPNPVCQAVIWVLRCDGEAIAFSAHIETAETVYIIANSYDERWHSHSPGSVLSLDVLRDACMRGKKQVDWGQGDSGYKSRWGASPEVCLFDVMLFRPGIRGRMMRKLAQRFLPEWCLLDHV